MINLKKGFPGDAVVNNPPAMQGPQETWVGSLGCEDPLEEGMETHFRILAWRIPWTEERGRQQSKGLQRVGQGSRDSMQTGPGSMVEKGYLVRFVMQI